MKPQVWRGPSSRSVVITLAIVLFIACCILPVANLLIFALTRDDVASHAVRLDVRQRVLLWNTARLGVGTALLATAIGAPLGFALARTAIGGKALLRMVLAAPVLLPPYVVALAWTQLGSNHALSDWTYSLPAAILVLGLVFYPLSMLATEVAFRRVEPGLEEAAMLSARPSRVFRRITLPLVAPSVLAAALVIFVLSIAEFGVPGLLRVRVYTTEVFTAFAAFYDFSRAVVLAFPLLALSLIVAILAVGLAGEHLITTRRGSGRPALLQAWRAPTVAGAIVVAVMALAVPLGVLVRSALGVASVRAVIEGSGRAVANSLVLSAIGATAVVGLAVWLGYGRARAPRRAGQLADVLFVVIFAIPSTIVGVGLIGLWNRPGIAGTLYGTDVMVVLGYLARFVPVAALVIAATVRHVPVSHEEAAGISGAGWFRTMTRIVLPQIRLGVLTAWVIAFVLAFGELGVSVLVAPAGESTLPIRIYTIIANAPPSHVAVLALLQTAVILCPLAILTLAVSLREAR